MFKKLFNRLNKLQALAFFSTLVGLLVSAFSFFINMVTLDISVWFISFTISFFFLGWTAASILLFMFAGRFEVM